MHRSVLDFRVLTPAELSLHVDALSIRIPTESGQVGVRPRIEPLVLAVEAGIVLVRTAETTKILGTAGGLFRSDGAEAVLLTPLAIAGSHAETVLSELEKRLGEPSSEMEARATLGKLEERILEELRRSPDERRPGQGKIR